MKRTKELQIKDKKYLWHPFTQMQEWFKEDNLIIQRGKGIYLYDTNGRKYLDGVSSLWCNLHGHQKQEIDNAIRRQLNKIAHSTMLGLSNLPAIELSERLIRITPKGLSRVFYSDSGSEAMEIALKIAFQYWRNLNPKSKLKSKFLTLSNAYQGDTIGAVSLGGIDLFHNFYQPLLFSTIQAPAPYCYRCPFGKTNPTKCSRACLDRIKQLMKRHHRELAGMVMEPLIQCAGGMIIQPQGFLRQIRRLCTQYDVLMIVDEVATGFGRTGRMFACQHEGVTPDIMALAKGLTGGYLPLAATLTTNRVFNAFLGGHRERKTFFHGHTYTGNPLACAAALASLEVFEKEKTLNKLQAQIKFLKQRLQEFYNLPHVGEVRQCGFIVGIELVKDRHTKKPYPYEERVGYQVILEARKMGVILRPLDNVIVLMPPLNIDLKALARLLDVTFKAIRKVTEG